MHDVLAALNAALLDEGERAKFVTVVYGEGRRRPGGGVELQLACAGHPVPLILRSDGTVEAAGVMGDLLGVFDNPITDVSTVDLRPGDALVCFTDGVTERRQGGRMLGEEGVAAVLESAAGAPAAALARRDRLRRDPAPGRPGDPGADRDLRTSAQTSTTSGMIIGRRR
jgi:serine phosphatase RsbU (regulator of sigma subunit)